MLPALRTDLQARILDGASEQTWITLYSAASFRTGRIERHSVLVDSSANSGLKVH